MENRLKESIKNELFLDYAAKNHNVRSQRRKRLFYAVLISLVAHLTVLVFANLLPDPPIDKRSKALQVWLTDPPKKKATKESDVKKAIVTIEQPPEPKRPNKAHYLAEFDQAVERETKTENANKDDPADSITANKNASLNNNQQDKKAESKTNAKSHVGHRLNRNAEDDRSQILKKADPLGIMPRFDGAKSSHMSKHSHDYLPNVETGDEAKLNTWQWRHAPFFNRIKARVGRIWSPQSQIARYDPEGVLLGNLDRVTVMSVTINREGELVNLAITDESGVAYLDEEAERAFRKAAPFLFPPSELFKDKDEFSFNFAFHLQLNHGFSLGFDWKND